MAAFVRAAEPQDLAQIVRLCAEHARFEGASLDVAGLAERLEAALFGSAPRLWAWVVEAGGGLAGYATASVEFSTWAGRDYVHMDCLYLQAPMRGTGLGRRLMEEVFAAARRASCAEVQWQTPPWNAPAIAFYRAMGAEGADKVRFRTAVGGR
ncbi:GNAT family N-acetyltransferase [Phenylobacterium sp.]|jgi:GNAT superfamily N-acetyltransferase|uniref:GNAT family N-acetyltransferase n=1 Tax=Phenylobacterium sp. TaxID=1871053 RepID=UPI002E3002C3|nr:GNAT family N-acetyltransferase [Phenylobacterium sp.]HEX2560293.1 GNAT family N-acetyltransferase [Phenylobacterium sp.]